MSTFFQVNSSGPDNAKNFTATMKVFVPRFRQTLNGRETARNKKSAQNQLAYNLVLQLFKIGAIPEFQVGKVLLYLLFNTIDIIKLNTIF